MCPTRKRVNCPAHLWSSSPSCVKGGPAAQTPSTNTTKPDPAKKTPPTVADQSKAPPQPQPPLKPVEPIQIPKEAPTPDDERLKQLESPETAELIKTFEITDPLNGGGATTPPNVPAKEPTPEPPPPAKEPERPPVVVAKPEPVIAPPEPVRTNAPEEPFGVPEAPKKDIKEATSDFLAQEFSQPKKTSKRYTKTRQKHNQHS